MWGHGRPGRWSDVDVLLLEAYQSYLDGLCGGCGLPLGHTSKTKYTMAFKVDRITCNACSFVEGVAENDKPKPGVKLYIKNWMSDLWRRP